MVANGETVVIPPQARIDRPLAGANLVLSEQGRLAIWPPVRKRKIGRRAGIELLRVSNRVSEFFANVRRADVRAGFPFIEAGVTGQGAFEVELAKPTVLRRDDWRRRRVRPQACRHAASHTAKVANQGVRKDPLCGELNRIFRAVAILTLPGLLLNMLVRHQEAGGPVAQNHPEPRRCREIPLDTQ
ncbi:MAG: hypothetical protein JF601_10900 [Acidobacteria bacterium]|nr:hypothetical protein [Acidobacteriota bacterium]